MTPEAIAHLFDAKIERAALGVLLSDPDAKERLASLTAGHFHEFLHRDLFRVIRGIVEAGGVADPATVLSALQTDRPKDWDRFSALLGSLPDEGHPPAFPGYVETLTSLRDRRTLTGLGNRAISLAHDMAAPLNGAVADFVGLVGNMAAPTSHAEEWSVQRLLEPIDYAQSLLGNRFLERGGTMALVAPSGIGKTVASVQMSACWSVGRTAFHISPAGALRVLVVQNEDTENDTKGPLQGVIQNCGFTQADVEVMNRNLKVVRLVALRGQAAAIVIRKLATSWNADLVIVNPLMAYVPGKQGEETEVFIREHLQPVAAELHVGIVAIHHTPKIGRQNGVGTGVNEYERQYNSAGKAEVVNAFRGIINIMPCGNGVFKFTADKRGRKIGWTWDQKPTIERYFKHASDSANPDLIWWRDATPEEAEQAANPETYRDILRVVPESGGQPASRSRIRDEAKRQLFVGKDKADEWLRLAIEDGLVERIGQKNSSNREEAAFRQCGVEVVT